MNFARGNLCRGWRMRLLAQPLDPRTAVLRDADAHATRVAASERVREASEKEEAERD